MAHGIWILGLCRVVAMLLTIVGNVIMEVATWR